MAQPWGVYPNFRRLTPMGPLPESVDNSPSTGPSVSRRRDKPQLSCSLCRKRKLKCDRAHPCETCTRRGLSASCTYVTSNMSEHGDRVQMRPATNAGIPERMDQLERLVTSLMTGNTAGSTNLISPETRESPGMESSQPPRRMMRDSIPPEGPSQQLDSPEGTGKAITEAAQTDSAHWRAILNGIAELKNDRFMGEDHLSTESALGFEDPCNLFGTYKYINKHEIFAAMPARSVVDGYIAAYFAHKAIAPVIIHSSTFLNEYDRFWEQPVETSIIWLGMLYAIMCLSAAFQQHPAILSTGYERFFLSYREKAIQCLVLGKYANHVPYTIETLLLYLQIEYIRGADLQSETWILLGVIVRLALRTGYHRDPSHMPQLSAFEGEMRRRVWAVIIQFDALASAQLGLPRMIKQSHFDTAEPRNLLDEDFDRDVATLPPSRPDTVQTPIQYLLVENKLANTYGMISDLTTAILPPAYGEIMHLDKVLHDIYTSIPNGLQVRPMAKSLMDSPDTIIRRIHLAVLFNRANCILHHKYMIPGRTDKQYNHSRSTCIASAIQIMEYQVILDQATQGGGRLYNDKWKISSLIKSSFLLATTLICLDVDYDGTKYSLPDSLTYSKNLDLRQGEEQALRNSYAVWVKSSGSSQEAQKAAQLIDSVLSKAQNLSSTRSGNSYNTNNSISLHNSGLGSATADSSDGMREASPSIGTGMTASGSTLLNATSIPQLMSFNANTVIDYSEI